MNNARKDDTAEYFTAGEMAAMFGISKQSLLYYDKIHLLSPDFISSNGYRHYSITQFLELEIIVNLRALDIPINDIQAYLQNRSQEQLTEMFQTKDRVCRDIIRENERIRKSLAVISGKLQEDRKELRNEVFIRSYPQRYIILNELTHKDSAKDRIVLFAKASNKNVHNRCLLEKQQGWIIRQNDFFSGHCSNESIGFFLFLTGPVKNHNLDFKTTDRPAAAKSAVTKGTGSSYSPKQKRVTVVALPESLYCEMTFDGTFYHMVDRISSSIKAQLLKYKLHPVGDIFVLPVQNHWFTKEHEKYVTKVFFQVKS